MSNIVDSSGWLEYLADGPNASEFAPVIGDTAALIVPSISLYEVFKRVLQQRTEVEALQSVAMMQQGQVVELDSVLASSAAKLSVTLKLPMADSIILATAYAYNATLWTQDADFRGLSGVRYIGRI